MLNVSRKSFAWLLVVLLLLTGLPVCAQEEQELPQPTEAPTQPPVRNGLIVDTFSAYQRAEQAGMYLKLVEQEETAKRVSNKLSSCIKDNEAEFATDAAAAATKSISAWMEATKSYSANLFTLTTAGEADGDTQIPGGYMKAYDFISIADGEGRAMLYPLEQYDTDLYDQLCVDITNALNAKLAALLRSTFDQVLPSQEEARRDSLQQAFNAQISSCTLTAAEARNAFSRDMEIAQGMKLSDAISATSDMTIGGLGYAQPVRIAAENRDTAYYCLTMDEDLGALYGEKLEEPVDLAAAKAQSGVKLWLNEEGELVYCSAAQSWLSADAGELAELLAERGGEPAAQKVEGKGMRVSAQTVWMYVFLAIALLELIFIFTRRKLGKLRARYRRRMAEREAARESDGTKEN